ncbi:chromatin licensing and DNA replication factor double parked isoform X2 [Tachypleus tridentatus]|uniref:chromatin licensing and DNA replication factor double parked isoform X2 n=1 Tax=Tachypleus tridentatus TaxID=6853 RepID=UPI003FD26142
MFCILIPALLMAVTVKDDKHSKFPFQALAANLKEESSLASMGKELNISKIGESCTSKRLKIFPINNNNFHQTRIESLDQKKTLEETAGPKPDDVLENILTTNKPPPKPISPLHLSPKKLQISSILPESSSSKTNLNEVLKVKITPEEMRAKLAKCGKLSELRECLSKIKKCSAETKKSKPHLQTFSSMEVTVEVPSSSKKSPSPSPVKIAPEKLIPAYKKYSSLAVDDVPSLLLPHKYRMLEETFRCTEIILSMLHNRREICTFDKLKHSVQNMMRRNFDKTHLGQIMAVFPLAYILQQEKGLHMLTSKSSSSNGYHLTITPNFDYSLENLHIIEKTSNIVKSSTNQEQKVMNPSCLLERKNIFHKNLLEFVIKHHEIFLSELDPPMKVPRDKLIRWHPSFQLDQVPDILPTLLPAPPDETKYRSAQDVLDHIRGKAGQKVEKALDEIASKAQLTKTEESNILGSSQAKTVTVGALKGVSQALLAKIRAKEAANLLREMTRKPEESKRLEMMARLPHLIRILRTFFIAERKAAVSWDVAVQKLLESYHTSISLNDVEDHLRLMAELLPDWLFVVQVHRGTFLKIDKNKDLTVLSERIENLMKQEK